VYIKKLCSKGVKSKGVDRVNVGGGNVQGGQSRTISFPLQTTLIIAQSHTFHIYYFMIMRHKIRLFIRLQRTKGWPPSWYTRNKQAKEEPWVGFNVRVTSAPWFGKEARRSKIIVNLIILKNYHTIDITIKVIKNGRGKYPKDIGLVELSKRIELGSTFFRAD